MSKLVPQDIETLVSQFQESSWREMRLVFGDAQLFLSKDADAQFGDEAPRTRPAAESPPVAPPVAAPVPAVSTGAATPGSIPDGWVVVRAPSLGTFYRSPKPGALAFCQPGDQITEESELCLIEVMKLFTTVRAKAKGIVREICVNDGEMVEFDQPLFLIEPHD